MSSLPYSIDAAFLMPPNINNPTTCKPSGWQTSNGSQSNVQDSSSHVLEKSLSLRWHPRCLCNILSLTRLIQKRPRRAAGIVANLPVPTTGSCSLAVVLGVVSSAVLVAGFISLTEAFEAESPPSPEAVSGGINFQAPPTLH